MDDDVVVIDDDRDATLEVQTNFVSSQNNLTVVNFTNKIHDDAKKNKLSFNFLPNSLLKDFDGGGWTCLSTLAQNNQSKQLAIASKKDPIIVVCLIFIICVNFILFWVFFILSGEGSKQHKKYIEFDTQ